jgi:hypothetical protein
MARRRAGLTQRELAGKIECRQATIARWERGDRQPSYEDVQVVVGACGLQLDAHLAVEDHSWWPQIAMQLDTSPVQRVRRLTPPGAVDVIPVLEGLAGRQVPAIVIGEVAGALHGWPLVLGAGVVEICIRAPDLMNSKPNLPGTGNTTDGANELRVTEIPPGTGGFNDLARSVELIELEGAEVRLAGLLDLLRIADASPNPDAQRHALAYRAVLDVQRAQREVSSPEICSDDEKIKAWLSRQTPVA